MLPSLMLRKHSLNSVLSLIEPMNYSIDAIEMLGDLLTEHEAKESTNLDDYPEEEISSEERNACDHYNERYSYPYYD